MDRPIRTFRNAVAFLDSCVNYERNPVRNAARMFRRQRMINLLNAVGNPQKEFKSVHIAGTKGKGSTVAMLAGMLRGNDLKVGVYTSPHILDIRERIVVDDRMISETEFTKLVVRVAAAAKRMRDDAPTFFELTTAAAFLCFAERAVDIAVVETGLGGRLDATNVLRPEVCGLTSISFDHMQLLGRTLTEIATEKAGILKRGIPAVSAPQVADVKRTLKKVAQDVGAPLQFAGDDFEFSCRFESSRATGPHTRICVSTPLSHYEHLAVPLMGDHQAMNCALALGLLDQLKQKGFNITSEGTISGLSRVALPGRMEMISETPRVLVDVAHNASSIDALIRAIGQNISYDSMVVIFGCNTDKDVDGMLRQLALGADKVIFTRSTHQRAAEPAELAAGFKEICGRQEQTAPSLADALTIAAKAVGREDLVCITGSFYLVADSKRYFAHRANGAAALRPVPALR